MYICSFQWQSFSRNYLLFCVLLLVVLNRAWCGLDDISDSHAEATTCCSDPEHEQWVQLSWIAVCNICMFLPEQILSTAFWSFAVCSAYNEDHGRRQQSDVTMVLMHHIHNINVFLLEQHSEISCLTGDNLMVIVFCRPQIKVMVFWELRLCTLVDGYQHIRGTYCVFLVWRWSVVEHPLNDLPLFCCHVMFSFCELSYAYPC
jgi:hypothetical protein